MARSAAYAIAFTVLFGVIGAIGGFLVGFAWSTFDEVVRNRGNPQGPLLFIFTGPLGAIIGTFYGWIKGFNYPRPIEGLWNRASGEKRP